MLLLTYHKMVCKDVLIWRGWSQKRLGGLFAGVGGQTNRRDSCGLAGKWEGQGIILLCGLLFPVLRSHYAISIGVFLGSQRLGRVLTLVIY